jgi:ABC-type branched-subunit amino acid transport system substrate-binding protein
MSEIRIGGLGPLSLPGLVWAGRDLRDGMNLAVMHLNAGPPVLGGRVTLCFQDTLGERRAGVAAVKKLTEQGAHAFAGEFHSMVADAIVEPIQQTGLPFICASATMDSITARRLSCVFRLCPPQSHGWRIFADFLLDKRAQHAVILQEDNPYWNNGSSIIADRLTDHGVACSRFFPLAADAATASWLRQLRAIPAIAPRPDFILLMMGYPEPLCSVLHGVEASGIALHEFGIGDPAGRAEGADWWDVVGSRSKPVAYLAYIAPRGLTEVGKRMEAEFKARTGREPTFVALEGYDSILVLAHAFRRAGTTEPRRVLDSLRFSEVPGTRGTIRFSTDPVGVVHQQWAWPPVSVVAHANAYQTPSQVEFLWAPDQDTRHA